MGTHNFHNTQMYIEIKAKERGKDLFYMMKKRMQAEQQMKRELRNWKNMQLIKKFNTKLNPIKELTSLEILNEQITKYKGSKKRWPERKRSKVLNRITAKDIYWENFYENYLKARDQIMYLRSSNTTIYDEIKKRHKKVRLMDDEQFELWEAFYLQGIIEVANFDQCTNDYV
jgi:hypothetical protein